METHYEDTRELSGQHDSTTSALSPAKQCHDRDLQEINMSHEVDCILAACKEPHNLDLLITLATSTGGLINDEVRKVACKSLTEPKCPYFPTLTDTKGQFCLAIEAMTPISPALLALGAIFQAIKMKIKSNLMSTGHSFTTLKVGVLKVPRIARCSF